MDSRLRGNGVGGCGNDGRLGVGMPAGDEVGMTWVCAGMAAGWGAGRDAGGCGWFLRAGHV